MIRYGHLHILSNKLEGLNQIFRTGNVVVSGTSILEILVSGKGKEELKEVLSNFKDN